MSYYKKHIFVCTNQKEAGKKCCANQGGYAYFTYLKEKLSERGQHGAGKFRVSQSGCLGRCDTGPCMVIYPEGQWFTFHSFDEMDDIIKQHLTDTETIGTVEPTD